MSSVEDGTIRHSIEVGFAVCNFDTCHSFRSRAQSFTEPVGQFDRESSSSCREGEVPMITVAVSISTFTNVFEEMEFRGSTVQLK